MSSTLQHLMALRNNCNQSNVLIQELVEKIEDANTLARLQGILTAHANLTHQIDVAIFAEGGRPPEGNIAGIPYPPTTVKGANVGKPVDLHTTPEAGAEIHRLFSKDKRS